jgi:hypothetical protein
MRVLAYSFPATEAARSARESLIRTFEMHQSDAALAPLADDGIVLAVRAREDNLEQVRSVLEQHGGKATDEIDEAWTVR